MTRIEELHEIVRGYRADLRATGAVFREQHVDPEHAPYDEGDRILWVDADRMLAPSAAEALAVLALLGALDPARWREEIKAIWMENEDENALHHDLDVRVASIALHSPLVGLSIDVDRTNQLGDVDDMVSAMSSVSGRYQTEYAAFNEEIKARGLTIGDIRAPVRIMCTASSPKTARALLGQANELANSERRVGYMSMAAEATSQANDAREAAQLRIHEFSIGKDIDLDGVSVITQLVEKKIHVYQLPFLVADVSKTEQLKILRMLHVLVPDSPGGVEVVAIRDDGWIRYYVALLTRLRFSKSVKTVCVNLRHISDQDQRVQVYQWLAYALFCTGSTACVNEISLGIPLTDREITAMREVIRAANPLAVLMGARSAPWVRQIYATRFHLQDPHTSIVRELWTSVDAVVADVIDEPQGLFEQLAWWRVLLPGYGVAWVDDSAVLRKVPYHMMPKARGIEELEFYHDGGHPLDISLLLESVGESVRCIREIDRAYECDEQSYWWFEHAIACCPKLDRLLLPVHHRPSECLVSLVKWVEAGRCLLKELRLHSTHGPELVSFLRKLGTRSFPLSKTLKTLRFGVRVMHRFEMEFLLPLLDMLDHNRTLEYVSIDIHSSCGNTRGMYEFIRESVEPYIHPRRQELIVPYDFEARVAFLSVVQQAGMSSAISQLDSSLCRYVFEFAGRRFERSIKLVFSNPYDYEDEDDDDLSDDEDPWESYRR